MQWRLLAFKHHFHKLTYVPFREVILEIHRVWELEVSQMVFRLKVAMTESHQGLFLRMFQNFDVEIQNAETRPIRRNVQIVNSKNDELKKYKYSWDLNSEHSK